MALNEYTKEVLKTELESLDRTILSRLNYIRELEDALASARKQYNELVGQADQIRRDLCGEKNESK